MEKETYIRRRSKLKKDVGSGLLLFLGNDEVGMNYADNTYRFRQDSTFLYFFGLDYAGLAAVIDIDEDQEIVFGNELTIDDIVWTGIQPSLKEKAETVGITQTLPMAELKTYIDKARAKGQQVHFLPPYRGDHRVWLWELLGVEPKAQTDQASVPFIKAIVAQRNYKDEEEIQLIEESVDLSTEMHLAAYRTVRPGIHESQVAAAVEEVACRHGNALAFPTIATTQGQVLHNHGFIHMLKEGDIFLLDAGAETASHYAGDLSSSMPVGERFTDRQAEVYNIHLKSFYAAVDKLQLGVPFREAHIAAATKIAEDSGLTASDVILGSSAADTAFKNDFFMKQLDTKNLAGIAATVNLRVNRGARLVGVVGGLRIWRYDEIYKDASNTTQKIIPASGVVVLADQLQATLHYGVAGDIKNGFFEGQFAADTWYEDDPPVQWLRVRSAPLPIIEQIAGVATITVS